MIGRRGADGVGLRAASASLFSQALLERIRDELGDEYSA